MAMLMPDTRATWESISRLSDSAEMDALIKQLYGLLQHRLVLAQESAAQPPSLPTPSDVREKARWGGGMGARRGRSQR